MLALSCSVLQRVVLYIILTSHKVNKLSFYWLLFNLILSFVYSHLFGAFLKKRETIYWNVSTASSC